MITVCAANPNLRADGRQSEHEPILDSYNHELIVLANIVSPHEQLQRINVFVCKNCGNLYSNECQQ